MKEEKQSDAEKVEFATLHDALVYIQANLNAPKDLENTFGNYKYRSCESILAALKPHLKKTGTTIRFQDDVVLVGDRFYFKSVAAFSDGRDTYSTTGIAREDLAKKGMDGAQLSGATSSYARKYALNAMFAIDDSKDSDVTNKHSTARNDIIAQAQAEINSATTRAQLTDIFNRYTAIDPSLCQKGGSITKALTARRQILESNGAKG